MEKYLKGAVFWGVFLGGLYFLGQPYREDGAEIGVGFLFSLVGLFAILFFLGKNLYSKEIDEKESGR
ncbi:MAG: hypothetical protein V4674_00505 [Patescibacteria group bacterium]